MDEIDVAIGYANLADELKLVRVDELEGGMVVIDIGRRVLPPARPPRRVGYIRVGNLDRERASTLQDSLLHLCLAPTSTW